MQPTFSYFFSQPKGLYRITFVVLSRQQLVTLILFYKIVNYKIYSTIDHFEVTRVLYQKWLPIKNKPSLTLPLFEPQTTRLSEEDTGSTWVIVHMLSSPSGYHPNIWFDTVWFDATMDWRKCANIIKHLHCLRTYSLLILMRKSLNTLLGLATSQGAANSSKRLGALCFLSCRV